MTPKEIFAFNLNRLMKKYGKQQSDIVSYMNTTASTVSDWCNVQQNEILDFPRLASFAECTGFKPYAADSESYTLARGDEKVVFRFSESGCFAERNGVKTDLRGKIEISTTSYGFELTTDDLTKLFDTEFKLDLVNGTAEITNMKK